MTRTEVLAAVRAIPREKDFVWDGIDEDDRPLTDQELQSCLRPNNQQNDYLLLSKQLNQCSDSDSGNRDRKHSAHFYS